MPATSNSYDDYDLRKCAIKSREVAKALVQNIGQKCPELLNQATDLPQGTIDLGAIAPLLAGSLQDENVDVCRCAAWAFGKAAELYGSGHLSWAVPESVSEALIENLEILVQTLGETHVPVVKGISSILGDLLRFAPRQVEPRLVQAVMRCRNPDGIIALMGLITANGGGVTQVEAEDFSGLLKHKEASVRLAACRLFGRFRVSSPQSLRALLNVAISAEENDDVRLAATEALALTDRDGSFTMFEVKPSDPSHRKQLLLRLGQLGETGDSLFRALNAAWIRTVSAGPMPGFRRLRMESIISYIFGSYANHQEMPNDDVPGNTPAPEAAQSDGVVDGNPTQDSVGKQSKQGGKKQSSNDPETLWKDCRSKQIKKLMESRQLRAIRIKQGVYDVHVEELESFRRAFHPGRDAG